MDLGFRFAPLMKGSKAENIAIETLLHCIVNDNILNAFKTRGGAEMLPLITVIVHLLCNQFANDQILPAKDKDDMFDFGVLTKENKVNDEEMDIDDGDIKEQKEEKEEKEEREEKNMDINMKEKTNGLLSIVHNTKLIHIIVSCCGISYSTVDTI